MFDKFKKWLGNVWSAWEKICEEADKRYQEQLEEQGCEYCGQTPVCPHCQRCHNPSCNAGCIMCRKLPQHDDKCSCCGK